MAEEKINFDIKSASLMLYLCGCALKNEKPKPDKTESLNLKALISMSKFHSLTALTAEGLKLAGAEGIEEFEKAQMLSLRKVLLFDAERKRLFDFMEEKGIWHMPLKGVILKDMYPKLGLRQMADNDILFDDIYRKDVHDWFVNQGYEAEAYGTSNHDVYQKEPVYNFEMHVSLYGEQHIKPWRDYYANIKERLIPDRSEGLGYHFTDEDFYIYFLTHGFKHFDNSGTGVRFLTDLYVYLRCKQASMDFAYINGELQKLGIAEFERDCRELCNIIFNDIHSFRLDTLPAEQREMLIFFLTSGTYGTMVNRINTGIRKSGKLGYTLSLIFPGRRVLAAYHPMFNNILLLPLGWIYRGIKLLCNRPKKIMHELKLIFKNKTKKP